MIAAPQPIVKNIFNEIGFFDDCNDLILVPSLSFVIGGQRYTLQNYEYFDRSEDEDDGKEICYPLIMDMPSVEEDTIVVVLGDPFLKKFLTTYDFKHNKIGIGRQK